MAKTLTAANCVLLLSIKGLFDVPLQLQGFSADDVFGVDDLDTAETMMGVDGKLSAGWVPKEVTQSIMLQADSDSTVIFETWYQAQQSAKELYFATGLARLPAVNRSYVMTKGVLKQYNPVATAKKILQPRKFTLVWEAITAAPV